MEREKPPYVPPMTGEEAFAMFGDRRLLTLEEQQTRLGNQVDQLSRQLAEAQSNQDADWEEVSKTEASLTVAREMLKETNRLIRKMGQEFGNKRGPVTLH